MRGITIATIVALCPVIALADEAKDPHFEKASELKAKGDTAGACAEFTLALKANPTATGLLLNVAQCNEDLGRIHSAIYFFTQLKQIATELGLAEYSRTADEHLGKLKSRAGKLVLTFEEPPDSATKVQIGDDAYDVTKETTLEVNPGKLRFVVSHPGRVAKEETIEIKEGETKGFHVAKLVALKKVNNTYRNVGIAVTSVGVVGVIAGGVMGLVAKGNYNAAFKSGTVKGDPNDFCIDKNSLGQPIPVACGSGSSQQVVNARQLGDAATGVIIAGGVLAVGGAVMWFIVGPRPVKERAIALVPLVAPDRAGIFAVGRF